MDRQRRFYVYIIRNTISGKAYVGKTHDGTIRWYHHWWCARRGQDSHLYRAMRKHGQAAFSREVLEYCDNEQHAFEREKFWIAELGTRSPNGYNLTDGGEGPSGWRHREETKAKLRM